MQVTLPDVSLRSGHLLLGCVSPGMVQEEAYPTAVTGVVCIAVELGFNPD